MKHDNVGAGSESLPGSVVYVVDDDESIRGSLTSLLMSVGIHVRAFESADDFLAAEMPDVPSCLILDVRLRGASGLTLQQEPFKESVHFPIIFLTGHGDIEMSVKAMKAGAFDFMTKPFKDQDLIDTIAAALKKDGELKRQERIVAGIRQTYDSLTAREREVIRLVADGLLNKQIADLLCLSEVTVKIHRAQAMHKLNARSVPDVVRKLQQVQPLHQGAR
ncbi:DNA-binding response regulator [Paraburkholderia ginsengiterrae]|uniref:DNA-binding response regulator n=1 Tax=Paraburkholderia ginsengiterrae TaxID=1462993 RepID=A0A1A9NHD4_9BURK|nr:response regulator [Paraburkholderia ginsengiterrae]OAJ53746.1 DNA-binding response regulator [Paraburkholderia ginsengiterrae]OAJ65887.1 DNA-binding response regulator [Paraburkholderia ginsengiterrae]